MAAFFNCNTRCPVLLDCSQHTGAEPTQWNRVKDQRLLREPIDAIEDVKLPTCALASYTGSPSVNSTAVWLPVDEFAPNKTACTFHASFACHYKEWIITAKIAGAGPFRSLPHVFSHPSTGEWKTGREHMQGYADMCRASTAREVIHPKR